MTAERTRALVGECISRAHVEAARGAALDDIHAACAACDYERAATLVFGRARAGEAVPFETIARLLPGIELPQVTMALVAITKERARLVELVERKRFPQTKDASELEVIALYAAWRAGADVARIIPELRRLSARQMSVESYALLATIAATIDDANVAAATKPIAAFAKEYAKQVAADDKAMTGSVDAAIASLPAEVETAATAGFTVRAAKQAGRNDPCPCGSGLKFKKCCADKPAAHEAKPSPIPGVSWDEFLAGDRMNSSHVEELPLRDLVRVDFGKLAAKPLIAAFRRFLLAREWDHAERVVEATRDELRVEPPDELRDGLRDELREELVHNLLDSGERERARAQIAKLPTDGAKLFELDAAIAEGPAAAWPALVRAAREAATDKLPALELAYSLLRAEPALGILAARACIGALNIDDPELMLDLVEEARDQLNIAPNDPAWEVLEELMVDEKPDIDEGALRESLAESSARVGELERALAAVQTQLASERTRPAAELVRHAGDRDRLDDKVRELEALIREGQAERRDLRKQLEAAATADDSSRREGPRARRPTVEEDDDDGGESVEVGARGIAIPRFERRAIDALESVPATVASETMRTVGTLAAGDGFAWRGVKAARDMVRQVLMARVGIHHRVLFRVEDGHLDVIDLITREQLLTTLKRLRANR